MHFTKSTRPKLKRRNPEHEMQVALFKWARLASGSDPRLKLLFAIPNGGHRDARTAARLRAEGVKPGVPDVCLPIPSNGFAALYLELKVKPNKTSPEQVAWIEALRAAGNLCMVVYDDWQEAKEAIEYYLHPPKAFKTLQP